MTAQKLGQNQKVKNVIQSWNKIKNEIQNFVNEKKIKEIQSSVKNFVKNAQKDLNGLVDKDMGYIKRKFTTEKKQIEKLVDQVIQAEVKKARKFVDDQKKELSKLQKKVEGLVKSKSTAKKATRGARVKKAGTRKATRRSTAKTASSTQA